MGGAGTITQTAPNQLTINQASPNLAVDWQSFSIGANNIVRFVQPSTSAVALNRVLNGDPAQIYGQIQANGQVVVMSPNGIVFGPSSRVDVNALVATTANISTVDFMAGKLLFDQASSDANARVVNQGVISVAQGGFAVLAAANVSNQGQIIANGGTVVLGGTKTFAIDFHGDGLLKFAATGMVDQKPAGADALVENSGSIEANGGRVLLTARAARSVLDNVINTTGIVVAKTATLVNGEIVIDGGDAGIVSVKGTLDASGANAGESGGTVKVLGEKVGLMADARIDASGNAGGGTVLVGGNYQGKGPEANAQYLYMDARAVIDASSASGDGGRVILWSDLATRNAGHINVSGARDGGFVEVSSKGYLDFRGTVDLKGLSGRAGTLLLDPSDITIGDVADLDITGSSPFESTGPATSVLAVWTLTAALNTGDVTVSTAAGTGGNGDITIGNNVDYTGGTDRTLTLLADRDINVYANVTSSSAKLNLILNARANGGAFGSVTVQPQSTAINISTNGGDIVMGGGVGLTAANYLSNPAIGGAVSVAGINIQAIGYNVSISTGVGMFLANGEGTSSGSDAHGVIIASTAAGATTITANEVKIKGVATSSFSNNAGVVLAGVLGSPVTINTNGTGYGITGFGGTGSGSPGVRMANLALNSNGPINFIDATGGSGNDGLSLEGSVAIDSVGLNVFGNAAGAGYGIRTQGASNDIVISGSNTTLAISANTVSLDSGFSAIGGGTNNAVTFAPITVGTSIAFNGGGSTLNITGNILSAISGFSTVTVGDALSAGRITVVNAYNGGATNLGLVSAESILVSSPITMGTGSLKVWGNAPSGNPSFATPTGTNHGVDIDADITATDGAIWIAGRGGTGSGRSGIRVAAGKSVTTTGTGSILMTGYGGDGGSDPGIALNGPGALVSTVDGALNMTGVGGTTANANTGIDIGGSTVQSTGTGAVSLTAIAGAGSSGGLSLYLGTNAGIVSVVDGNLTIAATGGLGDNNAAVGITGAGTKIETTGSGNIAITGSFGNSTANGRNGLFLAVDAAIQSSGAGSISIITSGGSGNGTGNSGMFIGSGTFVGKTGDGVGTVSLVGTGGALGTDDNTGITLGGTISGRDRTVTVTGTAGNGTGSGNNGIVINGGVVNSTSGNIVLSGIDGNTGVLAINGGSVLSNGGNISISGIGDFGVDFGGTIAANGGNISIAGTGGTGSSDYGVRVASGTSVSTSGAGTISVVGSGEFGVFIDSTVAMTAGAAGTISLAGTAASATNEAISFGNATTILSVGSFSASGTLSLFSTSAASFVFAPSATSADVTIATATGALSGGSISGLSGVAAAAEVAVTAGTIDVNGVIVVPVVTVNTIAPAAGQGAGGSTISSALTDVAPISQIQAAANLPTAAAPTAVSIVADTVALLIAAAPAVGAAAVAGPNSQTGEGGEAGPGVSPLGIVAVPPTSAAAPGTPAPAAAAGTTPQPTIVTSSGPAAAGTGGTPLVATSAPQPQVTTVTDVGGAQQRAVNGGALAPATSRAQTPFTGNFPPVR
ncbi:MAG: filamentous hemagglutinin N-terminal domain-containing protein [Azospirillum sp.]|nr:filamentous hemagglutinin N-terminal domain-containing protein [Azospirillum sp.]